MSNSQSGSALAAGRWFVPCRSWPALRGLACLGSGVAFFLMVALMLSGAVAAQDAATAAASDDAQAAKPDEAAKPDQPAAKPEESAAKPEDAAKPEPAAEGTAKPEPAAGDSDSPETAADGTRAGHSYHGEAFNEGPRQRAYLMDGMPQINFPITTNAPEAARFFEQGVGQLHGFWYFEAERSFRQAAALDPECAMTYWGMAMANTNNEKRAKSFIAEAVKRKGQAGEREKMYIDALDAYYRAGNDKKKERAEAYVKALEDILLKFPEDNEAKAFLALQIWMNRNAGIPINSNLALDALLEQVFQVQPMHPAHHYRIHLWDYPRPEKALASSAVCGQTSPGIAHMWHMPGHIYSRLKRYDDACWQQEASARVDHAHMMRDRVLPDQIHNFAHNNEWLIRNLNFVGRVGDAVDLAKNMTELPRHPKYNMLSGRGSSNYGRQRLFETLSRYELWEQMIQLCHSPYLEPTDDPKEQVNRWRHLGRAYFRQGDLVGGQQVLAELRPWLEERRGQREQAVAAARDKARTESLDQAALDKVAAEAREKAQAEGLDEARIEQAVTAAREQATEEQLKPHQKKIDKAGEDAGRPLDNDLRLAERAVWELEGLEKLAAGDAKAALELLNKAGGVEPMFLALVQSQAGELDEALKAAEKQVKSHPKEVHPLACQVDLLWRAGKQEQAQQAMGRLREMSASIDMNSPVFQRLEPVAAALGCTGDWRIEQVVAADTGQRPSLDDLGPFRWQPSAAPEWTLKDSRGETVSSKQFAGRPVVVIFYLGFGCLHCVEQLHAFAPKMSEFEQQGIGLVGIGSDDLAGLQKSLEEYGRDKMPIPLMADPELHVFKQFRVFDDFENQPLHATFLIDGEGRIRWQDVSYEPFMDVDFVLKESRRLLDQDKLASSPAGG
ncbi:MAG: redoxin domain-containing protein [Pirellulaceae bacterium]|nr:redoxin domain-containing protein [Pirellulaceae bacterium]